MDDQNGWTQFCPNWKIGIKLQIEFVFGGVDQVLLDLDSGLRIQDLKKDKESYAECANLPFQSGEERKMMDHVVTPEVNQRVTGIE